jgi:hypothetical protein
MFEKSFIFINYLSGTLFIEFCEIKNIFSKDFYPGILRSSYCDMVIFNGTNITNLKNHLLEIGFSNAVVENCFFENISSYFYGMNILFILLIRMSLLNQFINEIKKDDDNLYYDYCMNSLCHISNSDVLLVIVFSSH